MPAGARLAFVKPVQAKPAVPRAPTDWVALAGHLLRAAFVSLLFLAVLVPSDTPADRGMFVAQAAGWMVLALGVSLWLLWRRQGMEWGIVDTLAVTYLAWTAVAAFAVWGVGDMRAALNSFFQTAGFVLVVIVGRQLLRSTEQRRAVLTAMLALASAMALLGVLQYLIFDPLTRAELTADPQLLLEPLGISDEFSPEARRALDRALSPEPLGTFTLTNSLACFLAPWLILLAASGVGFQPAREGKHSSLSSAWLRQAGTLPHLVLLTACLLLTHSRMSILALLAGVALLACVWLRSRGPRWLVGGVFAAPLLGAVIVGVLMLMAGRDSGLLDRGVTSARYRLEYWQSTWAMIGDHWLLGVGPGNFKSVYPQYKLPQASEEIGDPHNFVLEVWSTAGTPGVVCLGALLIAVFWNTRSRKEDRGIGKGKTGNEQQAMPTKRAHFRIPDSKSQVPFPDSRFPFPPSASLWVLGGIAIAVVLVALSGPLYLAAFPWLLGLASVLFFFALWPLVTDDLLRGAALPIAAITMLINLLGAGGIGFPDVALPLAVLLTLISLRNPIQAHVLAFDTATPPLRYTPTSVSRFPFPVSPILALAASLVLFFSCYFLCYLPVFRADSSEPEDAMAMDPFSPAVCRNLARSELRSLLLGSPEALRTMEEALDEWIRRDGRSYAGHQAAGEARLAAYRTLKHQELLQRAIKNYEAATARYPNFSFMHAQLAWAKHGAADDAGARAAAAEALRLDALCPHDDKKLRRQTLGDPGQTGPLDAAMRKLASPADSGS
jgi:hypothetical protein